MTNSEWPSQNKLAGLREQGLVSSSRFTSGTFSAFCVLVLLYILRADLTEMVARIEFLWQHSGEEMQVQLDNLEVLSASFLKLLILPSIVAVCALFLATLLQTKFFITAASLGIDTSRISPFAEKNRDYGLSYSIFFILTVLIGLLTGLSLLYLKLPPVLELLNNDYAYFVDWPALFFPTMLPVLLPVLFFTGMLFIFLEKGAFLYRHRMSRQELLEEAERNN